MQYYIEIPFGAGRVQYTTPNQATAISDDLLHVNGLTFMRISGRTFQRITTAFQRNGWAYQVTGFGDSGDGNRSEALATVLMGLHGDFPGLIHPGGQT